MTENKGNISSDNYRERKSFLTHCIFGGNWGATPPSLIENSQFAQVTDSLIPLSRELARIGESVWGHKTWKSLTQCMVFYEAIKEIVDFPQGP